MIGPNFDYILGRFSLVKNTMILYTAQTFRPVLLIELVILNENIPVIGN